MLKLVIFDLDGTLLDTSQDICDVLNRSLARYSLPQLGIADTMKIVGNGARRLVEDAIPAESKALTDEVYAYYSVHFAQCGNGRTCLYPDEDGVLHTIKGMGIKTAIVTNKPSAATKNVCSQFLGGYGFDAIIGGGEGFPLKPDATATLNVMERLGAGREATLFVGDGETDVLTARAAGVECVSALWGFRSRQQLERAGATCFAENYTQFLHILQKKFQKNT